MKTKTEKTKAKNHRTRKVLGKYLVADSGICHGQLTFIGSRIFVADVLEQVADGMSRNAIVKAWHGSVTHEAIEEALKLSRTALLDHIDEYAVHP